MILELDSSFSMALYLMKEGKLLRRTSWAIGHFVRLLQPDFSSFVDHNEESVIPTMDWLLANDWELFYE